MNPCAWAACQGAASRQVDGWWMCDPHVEEHKLMFDPPPPVSARQRRREEKPQVRQLRPCGTRSAAARHRARGEEVCALCKAAEDEYYRVMGARSRQRKAA